MLLCGFGIFPFNKPDLGVDLFILLSGFLMTFQYQIRSDLENWSKFRTYVAFWIRRFFRISPLYYAVLIVALSMGPILYADRAIIDNFNGSAIQPASRYMDSSPINLLTHITYTFALFPDYVFRTPLPDWSLGLEMQFYAVFPMVVACARKSGWVIAIVCGSVIAILFAILVSIMDLHYPMPGFLPLKFHIFAGGMLIAQKPSRRYGGNILHLAILIILIALPIGGSNSIFSIISRLIIATLLFAIIRWETIPQLRWIVKILSTKILRWMGELSYGVYLIHLLILQPIVAYLLINYGKELSPYDRFGVALVVTMVTSYSLAFLTYKLVEIPGQGLGKRLLVAMGYSRRAIQTAPENIGVP